MKLSAPGHRVIVKPRELEKMSKGGILMAFDEDLERAATVIGTVVDVGPDAWKTMYINGHIGVPWAKVGDDVYYAKYVGMQVKDEDTGEWFRILNDEDIIAVISK